MAADRPARAPPSFTARRIPPHGTVDARRTSDEHTSPPARAKRRRGGLARVDGHTRDRKELGMNWWTLFVWGLAIIAKILILSALFGGTTT
jgi:hypothetical protein